MEGSSWAACGIRDEGEQPHADRELHHAVFRGGNGRGAHSSSSVVRSPVVSICRQPGYTSRPMEIFVYSRSGIEAVKPHEVPHVIISITSSPEDVARLRNTQACRGILRLSFLDADVPSDRHAEADLFSEEQAARVWNFVLQ